MKTCHDCIHSMGNADGVLWCYEPSIAVAVPHTAAEGCALFEREPGVDACERDPSRVWYEHGSRNRDEQCTVCGQRGHVAASCPRSPDRVWYEDQGRGD